ncbi:MAG: hypothetical protein PVH25_13645 [Burkholderiales bacterium]|jgi:hypothetical protein
MKDFGNDKSKQLAEEMGWTKERAEGYIDGETCGMRGREINFQQKMGMDEYSKGFRTGYYKQTCSVDSVKSVDVAFMQTSALTH